MFRLGLGLQLYKIDNNYGKLFYKLNDNIQ